MRNGCTEDFVGSARQAAKPWLWWNADADFGVGALVSAGYVRTEAGDNGFVTKYLNGNTTDVYRVKFKYLEMTFYIAHPGPDGKIHYLTVRNRSPEDEKTDLFFRWPL